MNVLTTSGMTVDNYAAHCSAEIGFVGRSERSPIGCKEASREKVQRWLDFTDCKPSQCLTRANDSNFCNRSLLCTKSIFIMLQRDLSNFKQ
jgi:hypothetical protein